jgi:hypothetical protein
MGHSKGSAKGKFIAISAYIKNTKRSQINYLMLHLKLLEKQEPKPKTTRREIIKTRVEINKIKTKKKQTTKQKINETKSRFFEKISKIDKSLANQGEEYYPRDSEEGNSNVVWVISVGNLFSTRPSCFLRLCGQRQ